MPSISIVCPKCNNDISIDEALSHQLEGKLKTQIEASSKKELEEEKEKLRKQMLEFREKEAQRVKEQELKIKEEAEKKISEKLETELKGLREENEKKAKELAQARELELKIRKEKNELEEAKEKFELEKARQLDEERKKIREEAITKANEDQKFVLAEKEKQLEDMKKKIEELQLKAQLTSQQLQGEVQELELEEILKANFPFDTIEPVGKGINGADVVQKVFDNTGKSCGVIVWESKRTKSWTEGWVQKLLDDQRKIKGDVAILVSTVLPEGIKKFGPYDKIYVTGFENVLEVAKLIRLKIIELCYARSVAEGSKDKKEILWNYLTGNEFKARVEAIVETFTLMREDMEKEKKWFTAKWAKMDKQIQRVVDNTIGMHGDLQGLIGTSLPEISSLSLDTEADNFETLGIIESGTVSVVEEVSLLTDDVVTT